MTDSEKLDWIIEHMATKADISKSEKMLLDETARLHNFTSQKIDKVNDRLELMQTEINTTRYSNETVELLLKKVTELEKRLQELEKTA